MTIHTRIPEFSLRFAKPEDVPLVLQFIRELADYEKLLHKVVATEAVLHETLFGERPYAEVILGFWEGAPISFALFFHNFSTFLGRPGIYLEDLYVKSEMRGRGAGKTILSYLAKLASERGCGRLEWSVLDWNESAIQVYRSIGSKEMDEWRTWRVSGEALKTLALEFEGCAMSKH